MQFTKISRGKTAFIVTHRLGNTKIADRIIVLEKGRVVEDGTHESLMDKCNVYSHMFNSQAKWYK
jgi:ATP-binding cassette subfamily B protein